MVFLRIGTISVHLTLIPKQTHLQLASGDFQQNLVMIFVLTPRLCWGLIGKHTDVTHLVFRGVCSMNAWTVSQKH